MAYNGFGYVFVADKSDRIFPLNNEVNKKAWISDRKFNCNELYTLLAFRYCFLDLTPFNQNYPLNSIFH